VLFGDEARLRQILLNLVGNAVKFTDEGFVEVRTRLLEERGGDLRMEFCVSDSGPGIPAESQDAIFEVFEQGDGSSTRRYGGSGLGLAISRRLVELFGGELWVKSEVGKGSQFFFTAWLERVARASQAPIPSWNVLMLSEEGPVMEALRALLRPAGGTVIGVSQGLAAVCQLVNAAAAGRGFDVLMLGADDADVVLPTIASLSELADIRVVSFNRELEGAALCVPAQLGPSSAVSAMRALANADAKRPSAVSVPQALREATILLVDDNPANRTITARLLEKAGYVVQTAHDGGEAVSAVTAGEFDLVLMDVQMPGVDGVTATERIRGWEAKKGTRLPIVGLSAITAPEELQRCRRAGMDDFLTKPIRAASLFETVAEALKGQEALVPRGPSLEERLKSQEVVDAFGDDRESIQLCLEVFLASRPEYVGALQDGIERKDVDVLRRTGHTLAGSFMGIIRPQLLTCAQTLEDSAGERGGPIGPVIEHADALIGCLQDLEREVRAFLGAPT
jgi:CheY-like chemotaxis protein